MNAITELVRERVGVIVTRGLDRYGYFSVEEDKRKFYDVAVDLLLSVSDKVESGDYVTLSPLKEKVVSSVFVLGFDKDLASRLFELIATSLYEEIDKSLIKDPDTVREYKRYVDLLIQAVSDIDTVLVSRVPEYLGGIEEYGMAEKSFNLPPTRSRLLASNRKPLSGNDQFTYRSRLREKYIDIFRRTVNAKADIVSNASPDINSITSDSKVNTELPDIDTSLLTATFAGEGNKIYTLIKDLFNFSVEVGGYEGSLAGAVDYQAKYYQYLMAMSYGKRLPEGVLGGEFGDFEKIYEINTTPRSIAGLSFLEPLYVTRSGNQVVGMSYSVAEKYGRGLADRYVFPDLNPNPIDFVSLSLESVYLFCLKVGDDIQSLLNFPPRGIGDTTIHMEMLSRVFPPSIDIRQRSTGFTGAVKTLLAAHKSLYALLGYEPDLHDFNEKFRRLFGLLENLTQTLKAIGFRPGGYVPSLALTNYEPDVKKIERRLSFIGFNRKEIEDILSVESFSELLEKFSPLTDSQDVISFFRAYDLTKLLYEFGGQEAIDQYVDFLYGVDDGNKPLIRLLELLNVNRSLASKVRGSEFSRLIGYVVTLTYAVDPEQLIVLDSILKNNNLDLFESISQLVTNGFRTVIKPRTEVNLLSGMIAQMVVADNTGYEDQKPLWNDLIKRSAGNVGRRVSGLYERVEGITPTELYYALNNPPATSPLGKMLDGVRGGRMTSLLRYCNIFGLLYTLSPYRNSGQLINQSADQYGQVLSLIDNMQGLIDRIRLSQIVLDESSQGDQTSTIYSDPVVNAQNKEFGAMVDLIGGVDNNENYGIMESPGIGNSRVPNGIRISNSLTPEEAVIVSDVGSRTGSFTVQPSESGSYVRVSVSNLLAAGSGTGVAEGDRLEGVTPDPMSPVSDYTSIYRVPETSDSASNDITSNPSSFNPLRSCLKFGGTRCTEEGYADTSCSKGFGKALYSEEGYSESGPINTPNVVIDRPLGAELTRSVTVNVPQTTHPQRLFTSHGLSEASRSVVLKDSEMMCGTLKNPLEYGACMSLLKCKKFKPPYEGRYWFEFCPSTLHGGRLRK